jgi:hypothetical protein
MYRRRVIPERRSLIRDRNRLKGLLFFDPGSRFAGRDDEAQGERLSLA